MSFDNAQVFFRSARPSPWVACAQRLDLGRQTVGGVDAGGDRSSSTPKPSPVSDCQCGNRSSALSARAGGGRPAPRHRPVELRHWPGPLSRPAATGRGGDLVRPDVIGVAVPAVGVIGDDDVRTQGRDDAGKLANRRLARLDEPLLTRIWLRPSHLNPASVRRRRGRSVPRRPARPARRSAHRSGSRRVGRRRSAVRPTGRRSPSPSSPRVQVTTRT